MAPRQVPTRLLGYDRPAFESVRVYLGGDSAKIELNSLEFNILVYLLVTSHGLGRIPVTFSGVPGYLRWSSPVIAISRCERIAEQEIDLNHILM